VSPAMKRRSVVIAVMTVAVSLVATIAASVQINVTLLHKSNQQLCGVVQLSTRPRAKPPTPPIDPNVAPGTAFGREIARYNKELAAYNDQQAIDLADARKELLRLADKIKCNKKKGSS
jgi:hypothetical protein